MNKIKAFYRSKYSKRVAVVIMTLAIMAMTMVTCFAAESSVDDATTIVTGITSIFEQVASNFSFANLIKFLGIAIGSCSVIALGWFGLRKVVSMIQTALKKGKVRI